MKEYKLEDFDQPNNKGWVYDIDENKVYTKYYIGGQRITVDSVNGLISLNLENAEILASYLLSYLKKYKGDNE